MGEAPSWLTTKGSLEIVSVCAHLPVLLPLGVGGLTRLCLALFMRLSRAQNTVYIKVPCRYESTAMGKFTLLMYMSEFRPRVSSF